MGGRLAQYAAAFVTLVAGGTYVYTHPTSQPQTWALAVGEEQRVGVFTVKRSSSAKPNADTSHHVTTDKGRVGFVNPWPSFSNFGGVSPGAVLRFATSSRPKIPAEDQRVPVKTVDFAALASVRANEKLMGLTWLGHAAMLLSTPIANVLLDPCLSDRCSPFQFAGPKRLVPPPCKLHELDVDVIIVSHNHYDHLDLETMTKLAEKKPDILFFVPLGNKQLLNNAGFKNVIECDWWDTYQLTLNDSKSSTDSVSKGVSLFGASRTKTVSTLEITCTPCQHFSSRTLWDRNETLWSSWYVKTPQRGFFFGGDTGYRTVRIGDDEDAVPTCPAFKEIKTHLGAPDLSAIPIGAFRPREFCSPVHCSPKDAVDLHMDIGSKKSVGIHWGTYVLTPDEYYEPPTLLKEALIKKGIKLDEFVTIDIGDSIFV